MNDKSPHKNLQTIAKWCGGNKKSYPFEMTRSILKAKQVPNKIFGEPILHATYIINRLPRR